MSEPVDSTDTKKRPASQYYWGDWHRDLALQSCPLAARGLWHEMNCLMHQGEPYGHLTMPNGKVMTPAQLANLAKISERECKKLVEMLEDAGVFSRTTEGAVFSRRMVRDEALRNTRAAGGKGGAEHGIKGAEHGSKGGRPAKPRGVSDAPLETPLKPPPSSSSSSSALAEEKENPPASRGSPTTKGSRLGLDWEPGETGLAFAEQQGLRNGKASAELARFRDYWASQPGQKGVKADWQATWRNWVRKASEQLGGKPGTADVFEGTR